MLEISKPLLTSVCVSSMAVLAAAGAYLVQLDGYSIAAAGSEKSLQTFYGVYGDIQPDGSTKLNSETLKLRFIPTRSEVFGKSVGPAPYNGKMIQRTWRIDGFYRARLMVLNILTESSPQDPKPPGGIGSYYLAKTGDQADAPFTGTALYLDCDSQKVYQCPYALSPTEISIDQAAKKWSVLFDKKCEPVQLVVEMHASNLCS